MKLPEYEITLKPKQCQVLPKKVCHSRRITVPGNDQGIHNTVWIADTRESRLQPCIALTQSISTQRLRIISRTTQGLIDYLGEQINFLKELQPKLDKKLSEAKSEWADFHEVTPLNTETRYGHSDTGVGVKKYRLKNKI